jgi:hypothetical protein
MRYRLSFFMAVVLPTAAIMASAFACVRAVRGDLLPHVPQMLHFLPHGDAAAIVETRQRLHGTVEDNVAHSRAAVPADCYRHGVPRACALFVACSMISRPQLNPAVCCVSCVHLTTRFSSWQITVLRHVTPFDGNVCLERLCVSGHI